jgi:hypothetical protein
MLLTENPINPSERDVTFKVVGSSYAKNDEAPPRAKKKEIERENALQQKRKKTPGVFFVSFGCTSYLRCLRPKITLRWLMEYSLESPLIHLPSSIRKMTPPVNSTIKISEVRLHTLTLRFAY